jgi:hypothetical protein
VLTTESFLVVMSGSPTFISEHRRRSHCKDKKIRSLTFIGGLERYAKRRKIQHGEAVESRGRCRSAILPDGDDKLECARRPSQRPVRKPLSVIAIIDRAGDLDRRVQADVLIKVDGVETTAARSTKRPAR